MSKCGKGCLPECEYFTTGGCISPFNCMYKEESGYINSATSGTVIYTGGMNMTNEEMIENLKCVIADIFEQCEQLKSDNAALRERLEKAVEFKVMAGDTIYMPWVWGGTSGIAVLEVLFIEMCANELEYNTDFETDDIAYSAFYKFGKFRANDFGRIVFTTREAAEAYLAELKGEKE